MFKDQVMISFACRCVVGFAPSLEEHLAPVKKSPEIGQMSTVVSQRGLGLSEQAPGEDMLPIN